MTQYTEAGMTDALESHIRQIFHIHVAVVKRMNDNTLMIDCANGQLFAVVIYDQHQSAPVKLDEFDHASAQYQADNNDSQLPIAPTQDAIAYGPHIAEATNMGNLISPIQLHAVRSIGNMLRVKANEISRLLFNTDPEKLNKRSAGRLIDTMNCLAFLQSDDGFHDIADVVEYVNRSKEQQWQLDQVTVERYLLDLAEMCQAVAHPGGRLYRVIRDTDLL